MVTDMTSGYQKEENSKVSQIKTNFKSGVFPQRNNKN